MIIFKMISEKSTCPICLIEIESDHYITKCSHSFHQNCIEQWLTKGDTCPICKAIINHNYLESYYLLNIIKTFVKFYIFLLFLLFNTIYFFMINYNVFLLMVCF